MRADAVPGVNKESPVSCGLGNYPDATNGPIRDGIKYLQGHEITTNYGVQGYRVSCSYGTGIFLSVDNDKEGSVTYPGWQIANNVEGAYR